MRDVVRKATRQVLRGQRKRLAPKDMNQSRWICQSSPGTLWITHERVISNCMRRLMQQVVSNRSQVVELLLREEQRSAVLDLLEGCNIGSIGDFACIKNRV